MADFQEYPKWVDHPTEKEASGRYAKRVLVKTKDEEEKVIGKRLTVKEESWSK